MNKIRLTLMSSLTCIVALISPVMLSADQLTTDIYTPFMNNNRGVFSENMGTYVTRVLDVALIVAAIGALFMIVWGGISWVISGGDKTKYEDARKRITSGLIGLVLTACAWAIWILALQFLGIPRLDNVSIQGSGSGAGAGAGTGTAGSADRCAYCSDRSFYPSAQDRADCLSACRR